MVFFGHRHRQRAAKPKVPYRQVAGTAVDSSDVNIKDASNVPLRERGKMSQGKLKIKSLSLCNKEKHRISVKSKERH